MGRFIPNRKRPVSVKIDSDFFNQFDSFGRHISKKYNIKRLGHQRTSEIIARSGVLLDLKKTFHKSLFLDNGAKTIRKKR